MLLLRRTAPGLLLVPPLLPDPNSALSYTSTASMRLALEFGEEENHGDSNTATPSKEIWGRTNSGRQVLVAFVGVQRMVLVVTGEW
jgi:hypothetical protein